MSSDLIVSVTLAVIQWQSTCRIYKVAELWLIQGLSVDDTEVKASL